MQLKGNNFTLICFHGNSFKAMKWALFSLNEPSMDFASQTYTKDGGQHVQQNLSFYLGRYEKKRDMASIYQVYRDSTSIFTKFQTINEWFEYAHSSIDAAGLRDFPRFSADEHPLLMSQTLKKSKYGDQTKWEDIFHLPSLQVFCATTQFESKKFCCWPIFIEIVEKPHLKLTIGFLDLQISCHPFFRFKFRSIFWKKTIAES